jgi:mono/diheme cytochrome c family protein
VTGRTRPSRIVVAVAAVTFLLGACTDPTVDKYGGDLFSVACAHCHGSGLGGGIGPPLGPGSNAVDLADEQIAGVIRVGPGAMPGFDGKLDAAQVTSLVTYLRSRQNP